MAQFRDSFYDFVPPWLRTGNAERYVYVLELMRDLLMEKADEALRIRLPGQGDASQIPYLAHDRQLVQGPLEPNASFVQRLAGAFATWATAGSARAILRQIQAYSQGFQAGIPDASAILRIVSDARYRSDTDGAGINSWYTIAAGDSIGQPATLQNVTPQNFNWSEGTTEFPGVWRSWLVLFQYHAATGQSGNAATLTSADGGSFGEDEAGEEVDGVWIPKTVGTPINAPFVAVGNLYGLTPDNVGDVLIVTGSGERDNNGTFQIVQVTSPFSCVIVNKSAVVPDAGPLGWSVARYGWIPPGLAFGVPGQVWGEGEDVVPPVDTGRESRGLWRPTTIAGIGQRPTFSWGLRISDLEIETVRGLVRTWKSAGTYYPNLIVAYDGDDGAFAPTSVPPFNPNANFGDLGSEVGGVWVPTRRITSHWDAYCQGTGQAIACGVENIT